MSTERLYYNDSHLTEFDARVVAVSHREDGRAAIVLDRTAFYPTGGGQPNDTGLLGGARVVECVDEGDAGVLHVVEGEAPAAVGEEVRGVVDWPRRRDHLQQHTGQHVLSQAFVELYGAQTRSFRMMAEASEIDVELRDASDELIERAVARANEVVWDDRPVLVHQLTPEEAARLPLRKDSAREGELRVIEIEGFDFSPCGGTHARRTGEVGLIAVRSWERAKGLARVTFVAGGRALADYVRANRTARSVAAHFSVARDEAPEAVARLLEENRRLVKRTRELEEAATRAEAEELRRMSDSRARDGSTIVARIFDGRDADALSHLASHLIAQPKTIALLGLRDGAEARLVFARSADSLADAGALMRQACAILGGRGGGRPDLARGGGGDVEKLSDVIHAAARALSS